MMKRWTAIFLMAASGLIAQVLADTSGVVSQAGPHLESVAAPQAILRSLLAVEYAETARRDSLIVRFVFDTAPDYTLQAGEEGSESVTFEFANTLMNQPFPEVLSRLPVKQVILWEGSPTTTGGQEVITRAAVDLIGKRAYRIDKEARAISLVISDLDPALVKYTLLAGAVEKLPNGFDITLTFDSVPAALPRYAVPDSQAMIFAFYETRDQGPDSLALPNGPARFAFTRHYRDSEAYITYFIIKVKKSIPEFQVRTVGTKLIIACRYKGWFNLDRVTWDNPYVRYGSMGGVALLGLTLGLLAAGGDEAVAPPAGSTPPSVTAGNPDIPAITIPPPD
ncbi:MAG: hypothetical protein V1913_18785 [Fibrobacterota bacterium]